jgi:hypothetical protein
MIVHSRGTDRKSRLGILRRPVVGLCCTRSSMHFPQQWTGVLCDRGYAEQLSLFAPISDVNSTLRKTSTIFINFALLLPSQKIEMEYSVGVKSLFIFHGDNTILTYPNAMSYLLLSQIRRMWGKIQLTVVATVQLKASPGLLFFEFHRRRHLLLSCLKIFIVT